MGGLRRIGMRRNHGSLQLADAGLRNAYALLKQNMIWARKGMVLQRRRSGGQHAPWMHTPLTPTGLMISDSFWKERLHYDTVACHLLVDIAPWPLYLTDHVAKHSQYHIVKYRLRSLALLPCLLSQDIYLLDSGV